LSFKPFATVSFYSKPLANGIVLSPHFAGAEVALGHRSTLVVDILGNQIKNRGIVAGVFSVPIAFFTTAAGDRTGVGVDLIPTDGELPFDRSCAVSVIRLSIMDHLPRDFTAADSERLAAFARLAGEVLTSHAQKRQALRSMAADLVHDLKRCLVGEICG
jgi:hypothetical protein